MAESTLSLAYAAILGEMAYCAGLGRSGWSGTAEETNLIALMQSGVRKAYGHRDWNFLKLMASSNLSTVAGTSTYTLPDSFDGAVDVVTFAANTNKGPITQIPPTDIVRMQQVTNANGIPQWFGVRPKGGVSGSSAGQRWEMIFYPTPDAVYSLAYKHCFLPDKIDGTNTYPYGGMKFGEVIQEFCLAEVELKILGEQGVHYGEAMRLAELFWAKDKKYNTPSNFGYNGDSSTRQEGQPAVIIRPATYP